MEKNNQPIALELLVRNHPGVMTHICGLFARRAFNVDGILCLPLPGQDHSHIWLLVKSDDRLSQMVSQVEKLEDVQDVKYNEDISIFEQLNKYIQ
ncbi:acetolactate synthase small subunit [Morganella morganii]|uniref:acetolactate synthase small subunit n=1 Tax=Morganella morganii TaxID=582 RepID=UPI0031A8F988